MNKPYLHLSLQQRRRIAEQVAARYNRINNEMQARFDEDSEGFKSLTGGEGRHHELDGEYAEDLVNRVLDQEYGHRKAFREGWGVELRVRKQIAELAIGLRKEYVSLGWHTPTARVKSLQPAQP